MGKVQKFLIGKLPIAEHLHDVAVEENLISSGDTQTCVVHCYVIVHWIVIPHQMG